MVKMKMTIWNMKMKIKIDEDENVDLSSLPKKEKERIQRLNLGIGDVVELDQGRRGIIHYIGKVDFAEGCMFGVELLDKALGTHNGTMKGIKYFECEDKRGIFVISTNIRKKSVLNIDMMEW